VLRTSTERPLFVEATESAGLKDLPGLEDNWDLPPEQVLQYRFQMAVADFDRDGWLDLALATKARSWLLRWSPADSEFQDVTEQVGLRKMHVLFGQPIDLAGWFDYDNDGYPDLVLGNRVYHNERGERMRDVTEAAGITFKRQAQGTLVADYDADGRLDLYILYQASTDNEKPRDRKLSWINETFYGEPNTLWRNLGDGRFEDVTAASNAGAGTRHHLAGSWFFYDDDRWPDLYIANDLANSILLRNRGDGTFEDVSQASGASGYATSMGVATGDTDNDGTADIYVANMFSKMGRRIIAHVSPDDYPPGIFEQIRGSCGGNRLYRRSAGRSDFDEFAEEFGVNAVGWAYAPAMTDVDNDGWLDLYATTGFLSFDRTKPDG
jgi:hypothetical protein